MATKRAYERDKVCIKIAGRKGRGVFANRDIAAGHTVEVAPALAVPRGEEDIMSATFLVNYMFGVQDDQCVIGLGYTSLYNHSDAPNAEFVASNSLVVIKSLKAIKKGQEILIDYGWTDEEWECVGKKIG